MKVVLTPTELHVWLIDLESQLDEIAHIKKCLAADELQRAERFLQDTDRQRFIASHAAMRSILGSYLDIGPGEVQISVGAVGKPLLATAGAPAKLRFNLSHSQRFAMVAVALDREVGVDVEQVRELIDVENIASRYFAPGERVRWKALSEEQRLEAFFRCWTRKEAYLKAVGSGISAGLDRFEVSFERDEPARLLMVDNNISEITRWQMYDLSPSNGYIAACAVESGIGQVIVRDWSS